MTTNRDGATYSQVVAEHRADQRRKRWAEFIRTPGPLIDWDEVRREVEEMGEGS